MVVVVHDVGSDGAVAVFGFSHAAMVSLIVSCRDSVTCLENNPERLAQD